MTFNVTSRGKQGRLMEKVLWQVVPLPGRPALGASPAPPCRGTTGQVWSGPAGEPFNDVLDEPLEQQLRSHYLKDAAAMPKDIGADVWT